MNRKHVIKRMISFLCSVVLCASMMSVALPEKAVAGTGTIPPTDFTELSWDDFVGLEYKEYVAPVPDGGAKGVYKDSLHRTLLNGNVIMGEDTDIRYAGNATYNGWYGLILRTLTDGTLEVSNSTFGTSYSQVYQPADYGLTSFSDEEFNLKISTEINGNDYTFGVWVNDKMLGDYFTLTDSNEGAGNAVGLYKRDNGNNVKLLRVKRPIPTDFTKLKWTDFEGFEYQEYAAPKGYSGTYGGSLDRTLLSGDIIMGKETDLRFAGQTSNPGWSGLIIRAMSSGYLLINSSTYDTPFEQVYAPADYGLNSFADTQFNLKISTEIDGNDRTFTIWINDIFLDRFTLTEGDGDAGSIIGLYDTENGNSVTFIKTPILVPTDFTELNWADFNGLTYKEYVAPDPGAGDYGTYSNSLHRTLFNANVIMGADTDIRYAGQSSNPGWSGLLICVTADGKLVIDNSTYETKYNPYYLPEDYGLTSFAGEEFNLKISTEISGTNYTFGIWVNDKILDDYFTLAGPADNGMATLGLYHRGSNNNIALKMGAPVMFDEHDWSGYQMLTPLASYGFEKTVYVMGENDSADRDLLTPMDQLNKVILHFHKITYDGEIDLGFAGGNVWTGFRLRSNPSDGTLILRSGYTQAGAHNQIMINPIKLYDEIAGVDLVGGTYNLKISMVYTDATTIKMGLWFNEKLYNSHYINIDLSHMDDYETGDVLGTHFGVVCQSATGGTITWEEERFSVDAIYWNKAEGAFVAPANATDGEGNNITELTRTGDYFITYVANGVIYEQNVYVWSAGDVDTDDKVNLHDLIRMKKLIKGDVSSTTKAGIKAADLDDNSAIDGIDADSLRDLLMAL